MKPYVAYYYVTNKCNDACEFCKLWLDAEFQSVPDPSIDDIRKNLSELKELGISYLDLSGGEPLMRDDIGEVVKAAKEKGFFTALTTNCILYPDKAKEVTEHIDRLVFSLDSPIGDDHDRIRGTACFDTLIESVKIAKSMGKLPILNFTMSRDTVRFLPEMDELAAKLDCPVWLNPVYGREEFQGFERNTTEYIKYYFWNKRISFNMAALDLIKKFGNNIRKPRCRAAESVITISADNCLMVPCSKNRDERRKIEGSIKATLAGMKELSASQGKMEICDGCMMWQYMIPSFFYKADRYFLTNLWSLARMLWKEHALKKGAKK